MNLQALALASLTITLLAKDYLLKDVLVNPTPSL
jgi:hypothetical protein